MPDLSKAALDALIAKNLRESPPAIEQEAPQEQPKHAAWWAHAANIAGNAADMGTTAYALKSGLGNEANPIYGGNNMSRIMAAKAGVTALNALMIHVLGKRNPTAANLLGIGTGAAMGGLAAHNWNEIQKGKP